MEAATENRGIWERRTRAGGGLRGGNREGGQEASVGISHLNTTGMRVNVPALQRPLMGHVLPSFPGGNSP